MQAPEAFHPNHTANQSSPDPAQHGGSFTQPQGRAKRRRESLEVLETQYKALMRNMMVYQQMRLRAASGSASQHPQLQGFGSASQQKNQQDNPKAGHVTSVPPPEETPVLQPQRQRQDMSHATTRGKLEYEQKRGERASRRNRPRPLDKGIKRARTRHSIAPARPQAQSRPVSSSVQLGLDELTTNLPPSSHLYAHSTPQPHLRSFEFHHPSQVPSRHPSQHQDRNYHASYPPSGGLPPTMSFENTLPAMDTSLATFEHHAMPSMERPLTLDPSLDVDVGSIDNDLVLDYLVSTMAGVQ
ncbi:hypothetical protein F5Y15DRAFT_18615 [Xylariaceae sp. FL0016]|nr:hypothetical protein F5Y15DRAFT_18615 [Xylariaceae sp. FL0016]